MILRTLAMLILLSPDAHAATDPSNFVYDQRLGSQLPLNAVVINENGETVPFHAVLNQRPTILALGYFHCSDLCGLVRNDLLTALSELGASHPYNLAVLSIDPSETAADARSAKAADISRFDQPAETSDWHYLTGSANSIQAIANAIGFRSQFDAQTKQFLHPAGIVFLTSSGKVSSYLLGLGYHPSDIGLGITRAENGLTAQALPILLLCFHYDEQTGRYTLSIVRILQLGAAITVLVIGTTLGLAFRRERRLR
jgi:protein SCO1/2